MSLIFPIGSGDTGARAFHPWSVLAIRVYGYATGIFSRRKL